MTGQVMTLERVFEAPRALVFDCFTKAEHLARWWGPRGFDAPVAEADARRGGHILLHMRGPEPMPVNVVEGEYVEVSPPDRLSFILRGFRGEDGRWGIEHVTTLTLTDLGDGRTRMAMETRVLQVSDELAFAVGGMKEGWSSSFDKMDELLAELR
jgi:uncharacterized protein YndB with AHSA1/START domain